MISALRSSAATEQRVHEASGWRLASAKYSCRRSERNLWARSSIVIRGPRGRVAKRAPLHLDHLMHRHLHEARDFAGMVMQAHRTPAQAHRSFDKDAPFSRPVQRTGGIRSHALVGGLHHCYMRVCVFGTHNRSASASSRLLAYFRQLYFLRAMPHVPVNDEPGFSLIRASPVRNAFGGQVIGSTARLRRRTSGSGSPLKSIK